MTKKDYELIASSIKSAKLCMTYNYQTAKNIVNALGNDLSKENPRFDYLKFAAACGIGDPII